MKNEVPKEGNNKLGLFPHDLPVSCSSEIDFTTMMGRGHLRDLSRVPVVKQLPAQVWSMLRSPEEGWKGCPSLLCRGRLENIRWEASGLKG